ncbi:MAG TPA: Dabb family protein [Bryobacteraceae bacterium]|jgi:antibiotic biosynthesis monooxygenase (ABM) superfamily enzyme|nr:Dabb family protein [Bryobacteraceae bacterium]
MQKLVLALCAAAFLSAATLTAADTQPSTVIHVITVKWKADATPAQISKALQMAASLPSEYPGIKHVWVKAIKKQIPEGYNDVIVMEFASQDALQKYAGSAAQKKWYDAYMAVREESRTSDVTN